MLNSHSKIDTFFKSQEEKGTAIEKMGTEREGVQFEEEGRFVLGAGEEG